MTAKRLQFIFALLSLLAGSVYLYAQNPNPVSIFGIGTGTVVGTTIPVSGTVTATGTVTANMGTVTADPFGANADAASATGSLSAKLRFIASTGIPITGTVTVGSHAVTNAGTFSTQSSVTGLGSGATSGLPVGIPVCDTFKTVSMTSATTTLMVTGVSARHVRLCSIHLVTATANNVALIGGTGATCGTGTTGLAGGTTAANGWNFAANGGLTLGSGLGTVIQTAATGDSVCLITSAAGPLAGSLSYAIY